MRIDNRLRLVSTATVLALVLIAPYLVWAYFEFTHANINYLLADEIKANFFERSRIRDQYFLFREDRLRVNWDESKTRFDELYTQGKSQFNDKFEFETLEELNGYIQESVAIFHRIVDNTKLVKSSVPNKSVYEELDTRLISQMLLKATSILNAATVLKDYEVKRAKQTYENIAILGLLLTMVLSISLIAISGHIGKLVRKRLGILHQGANSIVSGNLNFRIDEQGEDEFSEVAQSFNVMTFKLLESTRKLEEDIAERKLYEIRLTRESEKNLALLRNASDGIHILDPSGNIVEASNSFCTMLGYTRDEVIGMNVSKWDAGFADLIALREIIRQQLENPVRAQFETRHRRKDGTVFDVEVSGFPLQLEGKPFIFNSSRDITSRKASEAALKKSHSLLSATLESTNDAMLVVDLNNTWVLHNQKFLDMWGIPIAIVASGNDASAIELVLDQLEDADGFINKVKELYDHREQSSFDVIRFKDGRIVERSSMPQHVDGTVVGRVWSFRDVTERKAAEEKIKTLNQNFVIFLENTSDFIYYKNKEGRFIFCSQTLADITGHKSWRDMIGKHDLEVFPEETARIYGEEEIPIYRDGASILNRVDPFFDASGNKGWVSTSKWPQRDKDGKVCGLFGMSRDITQAMKAEQQLRIAATAFDAQEGMAITDEHGSILRVNQAFSRITGYSVDEVIGKNPRILKSGRQSEEFYINMWQTIASQGSWEGEIWNRRKNGEIYPEYMVITAVKDASGTVSNYVATFNDITISKASAVEIENLAFYDPLTNLPNRRLLLDRLGKALAASKRSGTGGALLYLDLDHFKNLNDTLGHDVGDLLLRQVAERLTASVREGDTVARLGGDEFVVMLEDLSSMDVEAAAQAENIAAKIMTALNQPYQLKANTYNNSPSIGITLFRDHGQMTDDLLKQADIAMYQSKKAGRNTVSFFDPAMQQSINTRVALEMDMWTALEQEQFELFYQIQVSHPGKVLGAEALIRWNHPERGWLLPGKFIPLAEESGFILSIGSWVLEAACKQLQTWKQNTLTHDLKLSINVSAKQFHLAEFVSQVRDAINRHSIDPTLLKLELTESVLLMEIKDTISKMTELKNIGIQFSLDDFGTGFSSLQYLKQLPIDQLKVDQSFVREIVMDTNDRAIVQTIIAIAEKLNLDIIAEGVETEDQRNILLSDGCPNFQGYLFGRPVPIDQFNAILRQK